MAVSSEIIRGCKKKEKAAIKAFYEESCGWMLGVARRYIRDRNEAMSIVNMSILTAIEKIKKFDETKKTNIEAWLKIILIRRAIDYLRKAKVDEQYVDYNNPTESPAVCLNGERTDREMLYKLIGSLPSRSQLVFNLFAIEGYKHKEIATLLNISEGTSKWHLNEARAKLKVLIVQVEESHKIQG